MEDVYQIGIEIKAFREGREDFREELLAHLKRELDDWEHIPQVHAYLKSLIEHVEGL